MAVGKSAIGQQLAVLCGAEFVDTDASIVAEHGSIEGIFSARGEIGFRDIEARQVSASLEAARQRSTVISLGGGAVLDTGTQQLLADCTVVYLEGDLETVRERILRNSGRPMLNGDAISRWIELMDVRRPVYERLADIVYDVRKGTIEELARGLEQKLQDFHTPGHGLEAAQEEEQK
ncbi:shikimate kinase [Pseudarthrobacter sp. J1738]|uniref:shikimate kinase n=1 Tax=Pseudarthrobacter sp. J1738 TaxID=3420446 RepID=UPI003D2C1414